MSQHLDELQEFHWMMDMLQEQATTKRADWTHARRLSRRVSVGMSLGRFGPSARESPPEAPPMVRARKRVWPP